MAVKIKDLFPRFETEKSKYNLNYLGHDWQQVDISQETANSSDEISALLLWMQATPRTKLGDVFQNSSMIEKDGYHTLKDVELRGLEKEFDTHFCSRPICTI